MLVEEMEEEVVVQMLERVNGGLKSELARERMHDMDRRVHIRRY